MINIFPYAISITHFTLLIFIDKFLWFQLAYWLALFQSMLQLFSFHRDHTDELLLVNCLRLLLSSAEMDLIWNSNSVKFENQYYKEFKFNSKLISTQSNQPLTQIYDQQDHVMASISCREPKATSLNIKANVS